MTRTSSAASSTSFLTGIGSFDWWLILAAGLLVSAGLMSLFSIDYALDTSFFPKQLFRLGVGVVPFLIFLLVRPEIWRKFSWALYVFNLGLLAMVLFAGRRAGGAQRWIDVGPLDFQPSELAKLLIVLTLASFFAARVNEIGRFSTFLLSFLHVAIPMALIYQQPHLGATLVVASIWLGISLAAKVPVRTILIAVGLGVGTLVAAYLTPGGLDNYQKARINALIFPQQADAAAEGDRYQTYRSLIAFGSGGVTGVGFLNGEQKAGSFVPEQETDFIFTVVGEEGGLVACLMVLVVYGLLFFRLWMAMWKSQEPFHRMIFAGVLTIFAFHTFANLGMVLQLLPVVGLWLPFMSFGGTALWLCMAAIGLALNVRRREDAGEMFG